MNAGDLPQRDREGGGLPERGGTNGGSVSALHPIGAVPLHERPTEWLRGQGEGADVAMSSRVRLARNLAGFPFVPKMKAEERSEVLDLCRRRIFRGGVARDLLWVDLHEAGGLDRTLLVERHLISRQHARGKLSTGQGGTSEPRGVAVSLPDERLSIMVNEEDHLRIQVVHSGLDLAGALRSIDEVDDRIEAGLDYAFDPRFGYLTACPTNVGTGARFSVMMHLPGLKMTGEMDKVKHFAEDTGLALRGFYGEGSEAAGDFFQISNQTTLGKSEQVLLAEMRDEMISKVVEYERHARKTLLKRRRTQTEDTVQRALGTLRHARLMATDEAMRLLSVVRLGVLLGLVEDVTLPAVHELLLLSHQAHLQRSCGREMDQQERRTARARLFRERLGGA